MNLIKVILNQNLVFKKRQIRLTCRQGNGEIHSFFSTGSRIVPRAISFYWYQKTIQINSLSTNKSFIGYQKRFGDYVIDLQNIPKPIEESIPV